MIKAAFIGLFLLMAVPSVSAPVALVAGFTFSFLLGNPFSGLTSRAGKILLQLSVVGLGFGINFVEIIDVAKSSLLLTFITIGATLCLGEVLGRLLQVPANTRRLLSFGTAICGGSAIAAMAPVLKAKDEEIAVSLATIFSLNAVALVLFPLLGGLFDLSQEQFGRWAALAIHDTSSVVGASAAFGAVALTIGTTVKLTRALWIVPCTLVASIALKSGARTGVPLFIVGFVAAAFINASFPAFTPLWHGLHDIARQLLVMTLFLIGSGLTRQVLRQAGLRPLLHGLVLWMVVSAATLGLILKDYI